MHPIRHVDWGQMGETAETDALKRELAALQERDRDLTDFLENASLPLHWVGAEGQILWANQAELDLLGYPRDEYVGRHIADFHADRPVIADILRRLGQRETLRNYEARLRRKDGAIRHVVINSSVRWYDDQFLHTRCFTRDITDRKLYEQRLLTQYGVGRILATATSLEAVVPETSTFMPGWKMSTFSSEPTLSSPAALASMRNSRSCVPASTPALA